MVSLAGATSYSTASPTPSENGIGRAALLWSATPVVGESSSIIQAEIPLTNRA